MRRFNDRFARIIHLKQQQLRQLETELSRQQQTVLEQQHRVATLFDELNLSAELIQAQTRARNAPGVWLQLNGAGNLRQQLDAARNSLQEERDRLNRLRTEYIRRSSQLEAIRTLRQRQLDEHQEREHQARQLEADDRALRMWSQTTT